MLFIIEFRVYMAIIMNMVMDAINVILIIVSRLLYTKNYGTIKNLSINVIKKAVPTIVVSIANTISELMYFTSIFKTPFKLPF